MITLKGTETRIALLRIYINEVEASNHENYDDKEKLYLKKWNNDQDDKKEIKHCDTFSFFFCKLNCFFHILIKLNIVGALKSDQ